MSRQSQQKQKGGGSSTTLPNSPSKWIELVESDPALLLFEHNSAVVVRGLEKATTPVLQRRLWRAICEHAGGVITQNAAGCAVLAALVRFGTVRVAERVLAAVRSSKLFSGFTTTATAAPAKKGKAAAAASATAAAATVSDDEFDLLAPIVDAACLRIDVFANTDEEREANIGEARTAVVTAVAKYLAETVIANVKTTPLRASLSNADSGVVKCIASLVSEKKLDAASAASIKSIGDDFCSRITKAADWAQMFVEMSVATTSGGKRDARESLKAMTAIVEGAKNSQVAGRAAALSSFFWKAAQQQQQQQQVSPSYITAVLTREHNCPVASDIASYVAKSRPDIFGTALSKAPKALLCSILLNCANDAAARELAAAIIGAVQNWPKLIQSSQLPESILGAFFALRHVTQRHPQLLLLQAAPGGGGGDNADESRATMALVLDSAARHYLKQTLTATETARVAVQMRLADAAAAGAAGAASPSSSRQQNTLLRVVDSDDDDAAVAQKTRHSGGSRRDRDEEAANIALPSPTNSAAAAAAAKKTPTKKKAVAARK